MNTRSLTALRTTFRTLPGLAVAATLMVGTIAGSATAAKLVTSADIKDGTVASVDVRNGTVTGVDVKKSSLDGSDLKNGSVGPQDLKPTARAAAVVWNSFTEQNLVDCGSSDLIGCTVAVGVPLPKGTWAVSGYVTLRNLGGGDTGLTRCGLVVDGTKLVEGFRKVGPSSSTTDRPSIPLQTVVTVSATSSAEIRCNQAPDDGLMASGSLTAVQVAPVAGA